jgi:hypothetical protein
VNGLSFAAPWGFAAAALAVPLTLWYLLRARRPRVVVSSVFLWRQTERSVAAAVPWQRFRPDRTYWLVLLAILAGAVALARPTIAAPAALGDHTIILLDTSASMLADEQGPSRLELARRGVRDLIGRMSGPQIVSLVEAGPRARVLLAASGDASAARRAVDHVAAGGGAADMADAFTLAASLQRPGEDTVTHLYTDGPLSESVIALAPPGLVVNGVGSDRPNLAVSRLQALPGTGGGGQAFVQVRNLGQLATTAVLTLSLDRREVARRDVGLAPRGAEDLVIDLDGAGQGVLRATVAPKGPDAGGGVSADALGIDDTAVAVLSGPREVTALVAGPGNLFVESALGAVDGVQVRTAPRVPDDLSAVDLLVVDRIIAPPRPTVPTLYIAPRRPPSDVTIGAPLQLPALTFQDSAAELLADVELAGTAIAAAQSVDAPTLQTLASGPDGPLLLAGRLAGTPVVYLPFALNDSNLPLQVAWPVLVANAVTWLAGPPATAPVTAGTVATVAVPAGVTGVEVVPPGGASQRLDPQRPQVRVDIPGAWQVDYHGPAEVIDALEPSVLAVNVDPAESDLARGRPKPLEDEGRRGAPPPGAPTNGRRSLAQLALAAVLILLVVEWLGRDQGGASRARGRRPSLRPDTARRTRGAVRT